MVENDIFESNDIMRKNTKTRNTRVRHLEETQDEQKDQEKVAEHELFENNDIKRKISKARKCNNFTTSEKDC